MSLGPDPLTRWLRVLAAVAFLVFIAFLVFDPLQRGTDFSVLALLVGAEALWLGYEVVLPFMRRGKDDNDGRE